MDYLQSMPLNSKLLAVSVCLIVVAVVLYFVPRARIRIPPIVFCALACFLAGIGIGAIGMHSFGFYWQPEAPRVLAPGGGPIGGEESTKGDPDKEDFKKFLWLPLGS